MQLYWVKIRYDVNSSALTYSQSTQYRIKQHQFKRDDIIIYDIPVSQHPFRIPGTHIGIKTETPLNPGKQLQKEHLDLLDGIVTTTMYQITALLKSDGREDYNDYSAEELPSERFSHRQNLYIVNELVRLRKVVRSKTGFKEEWVEVLEHAYRAVNVSGYGYHRYCDEPGAGVPDGAPVHMALSGGNEQDKGFGSGSEPYLGRDYLLSQRDTRVSHPAVPGADIVCPPDFEHSGSRPERQFDPDAPRPRSPMRYADQYQLQLSRLAENKAPEKNARKLVIPVVNPDDPKFAHLKGRFDKYYASYGASPARVRRAAYESAYRQDLVRGEIVNYGDQRNYYEINKLAVIGANEGSDPRLAELFEPSGRGVSGIGSSDASADAQALYRRILAQQYAKYALEGDESAYKRLRGLAERGAGEYPDINARIMYQALDEGADEADLDYLRAPARGMTASQVQRLSPRTRYRVVEELVTRVYYYQMYDTAPEVPTGPRPRTARCTQRQQNTAPADDDLQDYEHVSFHSRPQSERGARAAQGCGNGDDVRDWPNERESGNREILEAERYEYERQNMRNQPDHPYYDAEEQLHGDSDGSEDYQEEEDARSATITQVMSRPPEPQRSVKHISRNDIVFAGNGLRKEGARGAVGYKIALPSVLRSFKQRVVQDAQGVRDVCAQLSNGDVEKDGDDYSALFATVCDGIFAKMMDQTLAFQLKQVEAQAALRVSGPVE